MSNNYAPVIITTLNRHEHFKRLIESLRRNTYANKTDIYVGLDFPKTDSHVDGYNKITEYLSQSFEEFRSFTVIKRTVNYGSTRNGMDLRDLVFSKYDRFIRTDDDAEFSPNFLEYMNKCLDEYENDEDVIAVTGYSYPLKWKISDSATVFKENFICPMWGTGFWTKKYRKLEEIIISNHFLNKEARTAILKGGFNNMTDVCKQEFADLCLSPDFKITLASIVTDISVRMYMAICNKYVVMPTTSKVRNWGFDGSGEFCSDVTKVTRSVTAKTYSYHLQTIDENDSFSLICDLLYDSKVNRRIMNAFDPISISQKILTYIKVILFVLLGNGLFTKLTLLIRKIR
jgi:hypothetical protein